MAKAQELMTRHCIDRTMVDLAAAAGGPSRVVAYRVWLEDPYLEAKSFLLANVANANRCRAVVSTDLGFSTLVGYPDDLDATELPFTSLLVQATRRITDLGNNPKLGRRARRPTRRLEIACCPSWPAGRKRSTKVSLSDIAGWVAGTAAADLAELGVRDPLPTATVS